MPHQTIQIENANPNHIEAMIRLLKQLFAIEADFNFNPENHKKGLALMLDGCGKHRAVKVAKKEEAVIGMCTAQTRISTASGEICAVVEDLVVDENFRGRQIGTMLLSAIYEWGKQRQISRFQLLADRDNRQGIAFYKRMAWTPTNLICLTKKL